ncbi:hypothetical protein KIN20_017550 [Parelaphostrongylus tenuis]|uniref:DUF7741 domain-containing protein n=1 Tax=Parelaphostrongylus tenuis TaxID=148309 RepID=A0AAD5N6H8_PARTN|nr:hypothetical protein KIN20_017550 [Parelaphostrongylus tenuis]
MTEEPDNENYAYVNLTGFKKLRAHVLRMIDMVLILLLMVGAVNVLAEVACYHCYGNTTTEGRFCSINHLCLGESCFFSLQPSGQWASGCSTGEAPSNLTCSMSNSNSALDCKCMSDFCNKLNVVNETIKTFLGKEGAFKNTSLMLPRLSVRCIECGIVTIGNRGIEIPCDENQICQGDLCVTKKGPNPYSYCGTLWTENNELRCLKNPDQEEKCVCVQDMCNLSLYMLALDESLPSLENSSSSSDTVLKRERCKNGLSYSPNKHAASVAQRLGEMISNGFSATEKYDGESFDGDGQLCT